ncbi:MAG: histidinol-phosphatase [Pseudomonadales bacterium]|jgi:myo-inositol-1(or 4)-monophosphatase|nr:histidinol-phosphatase [Pseudomonadales bacterium]
MPDYPEDELDRYAAFALDVLGAAGDTALAHFRQQPEVRDKSATGAPFDPVTVADRAAEDLIRARIAAQFPDHGILGEEGGLGRGASRWGWTIDPIDGTRAFLAGFLHWGMLLALTHDGVPVLGVVHQPFTGETWWGGAAESHYRRGGHHQAIRTRSCPEAARAILASTDPYLFAGAEATAFDRVRRAVRLTRYGTDCYAYCMLASGHVDLVVESGLGPWDVQALVPLVEGAGGRITDWQGQPCTGGGRVVAAGDRALHAWALAQLAEAS